MYILELKAITYHSPINKYFSILNPIKSNRQISGHVILHYHNLILYIRSLIHWYTHTRTPDINSTLAHWRFTFDAEREKTTWNENFCSRLSRSPCRIHFKSLSAHFLLSQNTISRNNYRTAMLVQRRFGIGDTRRTSIRPSRHSFAFVIHLRREKDCEPLLQRSPQISQEGSFSRG